MRRASRKNKFSKQLRKAISARQRVKNCPAAIAARWTVASNCSEKTRSPAVSAAGLFCCVTSNYFPNRRGGWCFAFLAAFYYFVDVRGKKRPVFPLVVVGMNSIAAYCLSWLVAELVEKALYRHLGHAPFALFGTAYAPLLHGSATLAILWGILLWMHRRSLFLRL